MRRLWPWLAVVGVVTLVVTFNADRIGTALFGPPAIEGRERYSKHGRDRVDHSELDAVLRRHVDDDGWVDYSALAKDSTGLDTYIASLAKLDFDALGRDEKLALLINAYNAFTLRLILDHWPLASIRDIPDAQRWKAKRWKIGAMLLSLDAIEHEFLRKNFAEARMHFAINCASVGCPPLRREAYAAERIEAQLEEQSRIVHESGSRWFDLRDDELGLTKLYLWFAGDFVARAGSVLEHAARFNDELGRRVAAGVRPTIRWLDYDWSINTPRRR